MNNMKKRYFSIPLVLVILFLAACEQDPTLFDQPDGIYFSTTTDSVAYSFAKYPNRTVDTVRIPVMVRAMPPITTGRSRLKN